MKQISELIFLGACMMSARILVIEDDMYIQELIKEFLQAQKYVVVTASDGVEGIKLFSNDLFDLVILDIMMPNLDGYSVCQLIRSKSKTPIIILTALNEEQDQIKAFELMADDFITKPFSFQILVKRVEAVLRRTMQEDNGHLMSFESLKIDCDGYKVYIENELVELTAKEFEIIRMFLENKGKVLTRERLLDAVWGYDFFGDTRVVDAHIKNIRKKLGVPYIKTVKGVGYTIEKDN